MERAASTIRAAAPAAVGVALALALAACGAQGQTDGAPPPPTVTVANPQSDDVEVFEELTGRFQAVDAVEVRPQITGRLLRAHFVDGQLVRRGDVLFTIDAAEARASAAEAQAELDLAQAQLKRAERLRSLDAISEEEFDERRQEAVRLRAAAQRANVDVGYASVRAPISGRVSDRRVDPGNVVVADQTVLTTVVSQSPIHFEFGADAALAARLPRPTPGGRGGAAVFARLEGEDGFKHQGRLDFLDNQVDPNTGVVRGRAVFANEDRRFTAGQFGRIRIASGRLDDAILVPESAIQSDQTRKFVLVVGEKGTVEPRPVTLGPLIGERRVVAGVALADRVIVNGGGRVFPGMPVTPLTEAQAAEQARAEAEAQARASGQGG